MAETRQDDASDAKRSGLTVVVPTTAGAILIRGLRWTQKIPASRVVLGNETADQCERWTKEYNNLLRPGDPMRTLLGLPEGGGFRLVVTSEIDHGKSWIMPVAAGHFGSALGEALHTDIPKARLLIWTTGALDFSMAENASAAAIVPNDYQLVSKIDHSRELFATAAHAGTPVLCILPAGGDAERAATVLGKVLANQAHHIAIAGSLADLTGPLDSFLKGEDFSAMAARRTALVPIPKPEPEAKPAAETVVEPPPVEPPVTQATPPPMGAYALAGDRPRMPSQGMDSRKIGIIAAAALTLMGTGTGAYLLMQKPAPTPPALVVTPTSPTTPGTPPSTLPQSTTLPTQAPPAQSTLAPAGSTVARLTLLAAPAGSSCQAQAYQMQPRFVETIVDLSPDKPVAEIDGNALCGLAVAGSGPVRARFLQSSVTGVVQSLSSATRVIFNPGATVDRLPVVLMEGGSLDRIELRRR
jgi:hypothetical protein